MPETNHPRYEFKIANLAHERLGVNRLLYKTFVREIPRYQDPGIDSLVDKFDERNIYVIAVHQTRVCGMMAVHDGPDFSVAGAIDSPSRLAQLRKPLLEARIFAVAPEHRFGVVFAGLASHVFRYARNEGYANIVMTGLASRQEMYRRMGFRSLGPAVLRGEEYFVPMSLELREVPKAIRADLSRWEQRLARST